MFRSILVAVDGSPAATCALKEAVDIARSEGARLTLISVAKVPSLPMGVGPFAAPLWTEADLEYSAREVLEEAESLIPDDVPFSSLVGHGPAPAAILNRVNAACHDLVVMGSRGWGRPEHSCSEASVAPSSPRAPCRSWSHAQSRPSRWSPRSPPDGRGAATWERSHRFPLGDGDPDRHDGAFRLGLLQLRPLPERERPGLASAMPGPNVPFPPMEAEPVSEP